MYSGGPSFSVIEGTRAEAVGGGPGEGGRCSDYRRPREIGGGKGGDDDGLVLAFWDSR